MKVFFSAAEVSSDVHAAEVIRALKRERSDCEVFGVGGEHSKAAGMDVVVSSERLLVMGLTEILGRIPQILRVRRELLREIEARRPDLCVLLDYPDFHMQLAGALRKRGFRVVNFIPPKVWAWRRYRIRKLRALFDKVLCVLPFEAAIYSRSGVVAKYVGNPIFAKISTSLTRANARRELGWSTQAHYLAAWVGSRRGEVKRHLELVLNAYEEGIASQSFQAHLVLHAAGPTQFKWLDDGLRKWIGTSAVRSKLSILLSQGDPYIVMKAADAAWIKSGTSTLEALLVGVPHCVFYRTSRLNDFVFHRLIRYVGPLGLGNLVLGSRDRRKVVIDEFTFSSATTQNLIYSAQKHLRDPDATIEFQRHVERAREVMKFDESPAELAARELFDALQRPTLPKLGGHWRRWRPWVFVASQIWASVNWVARRYARSRHLGIPTLSVGNLQVGGAGKTPITAWIANALISSGKRVIILSRGYGRTDTRSRVIASGSGSHSRLDPEIFGDEPLLLHRLVPEAWIGVGSDRFDTLKEVLRVSDSAFDVVLLDDGFQTFGVARDWDLVCVTERRPGDFLFRDRFSALKRERTIAIWTKGGELPIDWRIPVVRFREESIEIPRRFEGCRFWLITGVADPDRIEDALGSMGVCVEQVWKLRDHTRYDWAQVEQFIGRAREQGVKIALTGKDWIKWQHLINNSLELESLIWVIEPQYSCVSGHELLQEVFSSVFPGSTT